KVTATFLERQRRILMAAQYAREHQNQWVDAADAFTTQANVDAAMGTSWTERARGVARTSYVVAVDIGTVHDPSVVGVAHRDPDGRIYVDRLVTLQGTRESPVQIADLETTIRDLAAAFAVSRIRVESWQGIAMAQSLQRLKLPVELFIPSAKAHADEWPQL